MATLVYDISVINADAIDAAFAHVERRAAVHNSRIAATANAATAGIARGGRGAGTKAAADPEAEHQQATRRELDRYQRRLRHIDAIKHKEVAADLEAHRKRLRQEEEEARQRLSKLKKSNAMAEASRANRAAVGGSSFGSLTTLGRGALATATLGGAAIVQTGVAKEMAVGKTATKLANAAFGAPGDTRSREEIFASVMDQSAEIGRRTGDRAGIVDALDRFVAISGSLKAGQRMAPFMADLSDATGAELSDIGQTGGQVLQNIMTTRNVDPTDAKAMNQAIEDTQSIMAAMAGQAKMGSIEFAALASQMGKLMSSTSRFSGDVADITNQMGAVAQLAISGGASSPEEAMTAVMRFADDLIKNSDRFDAQAKKAGIKQGYYADEGKTRLRDPTELLTDIVDATRGDMSKVQDLFGIEAMKAVQPFSASYTAAREGGATHEEAVKQVRSTINRFKTTKMTTREVTESAAFTRKQTGRELQIAWENLTTEAGEKFLPVLRQLTPEVTRLIPVLGAVAARAAEWAKILTQNPLQGLNTVIAAAMTAEIGKAAIGKALQSAVAGTGGTLPGVLGAALAGASIGVAAANLLIQNAQINATMRTQKRLETGKDVLEAAQQEIVEKGYLSEEMRGRVQKVATESEAQLATAQAWAEEADQNQGLWGIAKKAMGFEGGWGLAFEGESAIANKKQLGENQMAAERMLMADEFTRAAPEFKSQEMDDFVAQAGAGAGALGRLDAAANQLSATLASVSAVGLPRGNAPSPPPVK
jgi:hypothetical protein